MGYNGTALILEGRPAVFSGGTSFGQPLRVSGEFLTDDSACWPMKVQCPAIKDQTGGFSQFQPITVTASGPIADSVSQLG